MKGIALRERNSVRNRRDPDCGGDPIEIRLQAGTVNSRRPSRILEDRLLWTDVDVRVDQRTPTDATRGDHRQRIEDVQFE